MKLFYFVNYGDQSGSVRKIPQLCFMSRTSADEHRNDSSLMGSRRVRYENDVYNIQLH